MGHQSSVFLLIQLAGFLLWAALCLVAEIPGEFALLPACALSLAAAWCWHDGRWWLVIHALFLPGVLLALRFDIAPYWYLAAFALSWLIFGNVARSRIPLYLSNRQALQQLGERLPQGASMLDIGAGTGTVLAWLDRQRPDLRLTGVELAWLPWLMGCWRLPRSAVWLHGDYRELDFSVYDGVYAYLSSAAMPELWQKARAEMRPGALLISNTFAVPGQIPDEIVELNDWKGGKLLIWRM